MSPRVCEARPWGWISHPCKGEGKIMETRGISIFCGTVRRGCANGTRDLVPTFTSRLPQKHGWYFINPLAWSPSDFPVSTLTGVVAHIVLVLRTPYRPDCLLPICAHCCPASRQ